MSTVNVNQRNANNQFSTADYESRLLFIGNNDTDRASIAAGGSDVTIQPGTILVRSDSNNNVSALTGTADMHRLVGIIFTENEIVIPANTSRTITYCIGGKINPAFLNLPVGITLASHSDEQDRTLRDHLQGRQFHVVSSVDPTKFDN